MKVAALRALAVLEAPAETETVFGGRNRIWTQVASFWIALAPTGHREAGEGGLKPALTETADAVARTSAVVRPGQRLTAGGNAWRVVAVRAATPGPGAMTLKLERTWS